jgi:hypothetical protein
MDDNFYYFLLAIPATCAFWFLYMIIVTELANWSTRRRIRARAAQPSPVSAASDESRQLKKQQTKAIRGFDSPDVFRDDLLKRIRHLEKQIAESSKERETPKS